MPQTLSIGEMRKNINRLPEQLAESPETGAITITRRGKPVLAVLSWDLYESVLETLEIVADEKLMKTFRKSIQELDSGQGIPWEEAQKELAK
ncbi:MAG: type II toxin-antitoxin system Phd/YefM family antitoxin [Candidatus Latescibacteria bacterium]|nr:type II toxin-antitoxin system Phd/YefM family antitoxin [Candidatus Latescibacterota bacterium]MBT5831537.1 type II toxin-antitoxin system Phd/YefM family antitoxin [Candidatus Latescibacterota bacterium]